MKFSVALSLSVAPLALAKAVHNVYPVRREVASQNKVVDGRSVSFQNGMSGFGLSSSALTEVIIIWVNPGSGSATTTINPQAGQTVIPGAVGTPPPAAVAPPPTVGVGAAPVAAAPGALTTHQVSFDEVACL